MSLSTAEINTTDLPKGNQNGEKNTLYMKQRGYLVHSQAIKPLEHGVIQLGEYMRPPQTGLRAKPPQSVLRIQLIAARFLLLSF